MPQNKYTKKIEELERNKKFDEHLKEVNDKYVGKIDPNKFKYTYKNVFWKMYSFLVRLFVYLVGPLVTLNYFELKVKGKKNLRAIKKTGAVVVSNHVHTLDSLYLMQITRSRKMYFLAAPFNNKKGLAGLTLRAAGLLPIGNGVKLARQLDSTIAELLKDKKLLVINAEESMWLGYTKIRPFKKGAFHFAAKNNCPVVPVVALFRKTNKFDKLIHRKYKVTLQILPPIFPKKEFNYRENVEYLNNECHKAMVAYANKFYGTECDALKIADLLNSNGEKEAFNDSKENSIVDKIDA